MTYPALQAARDNGWCKFVEGTPQNFHDSLLRLRGSHLDLPQLSTDIASPYYLSSAPVSEDEDSGSDEDAEVMHGRLQEHGQATDGFESHAPS